MNTLLITAIIMGFALLILGYRRRNVEEFNGFSNTALKRALRGDISGKVIKEMKEAIIIDSQNKQSNKIIKL